MKFKVEKYVSNFVESQFPSFYQEEGKNFILFLKCYYEWMEESGNPINESRNLYDYRDIDNTLESFLEHFQKKYLYGIPFNVIANKRFLLKHILDVYRSKGSINCYKLLFKLLYNQDVEIYLPSNDILRVSDGTWVEPKYIEISKNDILPSLIGKEIIGASSGTTAIVENIIEENFNNDLIYIAYLTNILPVGGDFNISERIVTRDKLNDPLFLSNAPTVLGSLDKMEIINGGSGFKIGDLIKIAYRDSSNNEIISYGKDGILKVTELSRGYGSLNFDIISSGFGYTANAATFLYKNDLTGNGAQFSIGSIISTQKIDYNTDLICDYANLLLNATSFNFPGNTSANLSSNIGDVFEYSNDVFGSVYSLSNIKTGNGYTQPANLFIRSCQFSNKLPGNVVYNSTNTEINGTGTKFTWYFSNNDVIALQANSSLNSSKEYQVIKQVVSNTKLILWGPPSLNSTSSSSFRAAPAILPANYALYNPIMQRTDDTINGLNCIIKALPSIGNNIAATAIAINSGKGYNENEQVKAYLYSAISNNFNIISTGINYTNGEIVNFYGGSPSIQASGYITTNSNGSIDYVTLTNPGSGFQSVPTIKIKTQNGSGAVILANLDEFNLSSEVIGRIKKKGIGRGRGYWSTTRGFLNSDKYIQDSYYYQDFSYEIKVSETLNKYKDILYNTFHPAGSELFGKYLLKSEQSTTVSILYEDTEVTIT